MNYAKQYELLCYSRKSLNRNKFTDGEYYEVHHIVPECLGGKGNKKKWKNHPNLVLFTPKEHYIAHALLAKAYPEIEKLQYCLNYKSSKEYENRALLNNKAYKEKRKLKDKSGLTVEQRIKKKQKKKIKQKRRKKELKAYKSAQTAQENSIPPKK